MENYDNWINERFRKNVENKWCTMRIADGVCTQFPCNAETHYDIMIGTNEAYFL